MKTIRTLSLICFIFIFTIEAHAASLLAACSDNSSVANCPSSKLFFPIYAKSGSKTPFKFKVDPSGLGDIDADTAFNSTIEVLDLWEAESSLDFQQVDGGKFNSDINVSNYDPILSPSSPLGFSPIVFDDDGSITDDLLGNGAKESVLGFAGARFANSSAGIKESQAVFNGFLYDRDNVGGTLADVLNEFQTTILHEFGHMFGLDHTQGGDLDRFNAGTADVTDIPVMFPISGNTLIELQKDDIASVKEAYPLGDEATLYGRVEGKLLKNGSPIKGANIVAYKVGDSNPRKKAVACPSDVNGKGAGAFLLPNLDPGTYIIYAEPIDPDFVEGSSVGIHDPISPSLMTTGFYKGDGELVLATSNLNTGISQALQLNVTAGATTNIVFDIGNNPVGGGNNNGAEASFSLSGRALNTDKGIFLNNFSNKIVKFKISNPNPGTSKTVKLSTDYPDLIHFLPSDTITFRKGVKQVSVQFAGYVYFQDAISDIDDLGSAFIPLTVEDLGTGYIDDTQGFLVF
jgi:hypothetical protein